jgi:hypothetical protein
MTVGIEGEHARGNAGNHSDSPHRLHPMQRDNPEEREREREREIKEERSKFGMKLRKRRERKGGKGKKNSKP